MAWYADSQAGIGAGEIGTRRVLAGFAGNPYLVFGARPRREKRIRSYILRQHRAGRPLAQILQDERLGALASPTLVWGVVIDPATLRALVDDVRHEFDSDSGSLE